MIGCERLFNGRDHRSQKGRGRHINLPTSLRQRAMSIAAALALVEGGKSLLGLISMAQPSGRKQDQKPHAHRPSLPRQVQSTPKVPASHNTCGSQCLGMHGSPPEHTPRRQISLNCRLVLNLLTHRSASKATMQYNTSYKPPKSPCNSPKGRPHVTYCYRCQLQANWLS